MPFCFLPTLEISRAGPAPSREKKHSAFCTGIGSPFFRRRSLWIFRRLSFGLFLLEFDSGRNSHYFSSQHERLFGCGFDHAFGVWSHLRTPSFYFSFGTHGASDLPP